jgi:hypothetical protein
MFYFALISVQNGDKWLWDNMKEIVFFPDNKIYIMPVPEYRFNQYGN